jgi:hypothetical protein
MWNVTIDRLEPFNLYDVGYKRKLLERHIYKHRTAKAALRRLGSIISGKLRKRHQMAHHFYVIGPDGERYTWSTLKEHIRQAGIEQV